MPQSIDFSNIDRAVQLAGLLDVLANPSAVKGMLDEMKAGKAELVAYVEAKAKLDQVDDYVAKQREVLNQEKMQFIADKEAFDKQRDAEKASAAAAVVSANQMYADAEEAQKAAMAKQMEAADVLMNAQAVAEAVEKRKAELADYEQQLADRVAALNAKEQKLKELIGG